MLVRRVAVLLVCALALAAVPGTAAADPITEAKRRLTVLTKKIQDAEAREGLLADKVTRLDRELKATERDLAAVRERYAVRARAAYQNGLGGDLLVVMMSAEDTS